MSVYFMSSLSMNISWILTVSWCGFLELGVEKDQWNCPVTWPEAGWSVTPGSQGGRIVRPGDQRLLPLYVLIWGLCGILQQRSHPSSLFSQSRSTESPKQECLKGPGSFEAMVWAQSGQHQHCPCVPDRQMDGKTEAPICGHKNEV